MLSEHYLSDDQDPRTAEKVLEKLGDMLTSGEAVIYLAIQKKPAVTLIPDCIAVTNKRIVFRIMKKWEIANNRTQINKDIVNVLPFIKVWYSKNYFFETGVFTPAFGIAISWLKWNYYLTIQQGYKK